MIDGKQGSSHLSSPTCPFPVVVVVCEVFGIVRCRWAEVSVAEEKVPNTPYFKRCVWAVVPPGRACLDRESLGLSWCGTGEQIEVARRHAID